MDELPPAPGSFAEFHARLGGVPLHRIWMNPPPGTATEADLIAKWETPPGSLCELVDATLIARCGTFRGSIILGALARAVGRFVDEHDLGPCFAGNLPYRLRPDLIRVPSFAYAPWERFPDDGVPDEKIATFTPLLVVEVANSKTTASEFDRKIGEFFAAGTRLAWVIEPATNSVKAYTSARRLKELGESDTLDGGKVLPGFKLSLADLFAVGKPRKKKPR
jgi:Uma2 family endonuclease